MREHSLLERGPHTNDFLAGCDNLAVEAGEAQGRLRGRDERNRVHSGGLPMGSRLREEVMSSESVGTGAQVWTRVWELQEGQGRGSEAGGPGCALGPEGMSEPENVTMGTEGMTGFQLLPLGWGTGGWEKKSPGVHAAREA